MNSLSTQEPLTPEGPSTADQLKELILQALQARYTSESCKDGIKTGNHYQSVMLGDLQTTGFRTDRREFLDQIDFQGKRVLDLGSNLGEISRAVRASGADLVDGFEYDPYFLEIARLINAYNQVTRVSFYQRDITDPAIYGEHYDIVLAFSVFTYVEPVLRQIAAITGQAFVLETHKLDGNLDSGYLAPVLQHFPYYRILGESEWGTPHDPSARRAVVVFAKQEAALAASLKPPLGDRAAAPKQPAVAARALESSTDAGAVRAAASAEPGHAAKELAPALHARPADTERSIDYIDIRRTCLQKQFFSTFEFDSTDDLLATIAAMQIDLDTIAQSCDVRSYVYSGWVYWLLYVKGYLQYVESGTVGSGNLYYNYLIKYYGPRDHDPGLRRVLADPGATAACVARRFQDFEVFRRHAAEDPQLLERIAPIHVMVGDRPLENRLRLYQIGSNAPLHAKLVDGWHRLFAAKLCGIEKLRCQIIPVGYAPIAEDQAQLQARCATLAAQKDSALHEADRLQQRLAALAMDNESARQDFASLRQTVVEQNEYLDALAATIERISRREDNIRAIILTAHDQLLQRVIQIQSTMVAPQPPAPGPLDTPMPEPGLLPIQPGAYHQLGTYIGYQQLVAHIQEVVRAVLPPHCTILVASKGDDDLLTLQDRRGWHFPQNEDGVYAGCYPADSAAAIAHLEALRTKGSDFLLFPSTAFWWLEHYGELREHLDMCYRRTWQDQHCMIYQLSDVEPGGVQEHGRNDRDRGLARSEAETWGPHLGFPTIPARL